MGTDKTTTRAVVVTIVVMLLSIMGNLIATQHGMRDIVSDSLLDEDNPIVRSSEHVAREAPEFGEAIRIVRHFPDGINVERGDLEVIENIHAKLEEFPKFQERGVEFISPASYQAFVWKVEEEYFEDEVYTQQEMTTMEWRDLVKRNDNVYRLLVSEDFTQVAFVFYGTPETKSEELFWELVELVEEREPTWLDKLVKTDIVPADEMISVSGWIVARNLINLLSRVENIKIIACTLVLALGLFYLAVGSLRQTFATLAVLLLLLAFERGLIGLITWLGFVFDETAYTTLAYAITIVQTLSLSLHSFSPYNRSVKSWQEIRKEISPLFHATVGVAFVGFLSYLWFPVRPMLELGVMSCITALAMLLAVLYLLPLFAGSKRPEVRGATLPTQLVGGIFDGLASWCFFATARAMRYPRIYRAAAISIVALLWITVLAGTKQGWLTLGGDPIGFLKGTTIEESHAKLDREGGLGFTAIDFYLEVDGKHECAEVHAKNVPCWVNPVWLAKANELLKRVRLLPDVRGVASVVAELDYLSRERYEGRGLEDLSEREARRLYRYVAESETLESLQQQLWTDRGVRNLASATTAGNSLRQARINDNLTALEAWRWNKLSPFGLTAQYPEVDKEIIRNQVSNLLTDVLALAVIGGLWLGFRLRATLELQAVLRMAVALSVPFLFASAALLALMMVLGVPVDIATAAIGGMTIAAAADFALQFFAGFVAGTKSSQYVEDAHFHAFKYKGRDVIVDFVANTIVFLPLALSSFLPIARLGWLMGAMLLFSAVGTLLLAPAFFPFLVERRSK